MTTDTKPDAERAEAQALALREAEEVVGSLARRPVLDYVNTRQLDLIRARSARAGRGASPTDVEIGQFLELCVAYGLDPYAGEAWCAKSPGKNGGPGQLLIMVGRDGLRKIAQREGLMIDCDVVREKDSYEVARSADGRRGVAHSYSGSDRQRGPVVGAWAEVREAWDKGGRQRGYFYAALSEYKPSGAKLQYSPWGSQESVMILAAAERQALRQATPLGGLLAEGEDAKVDASPQPAVESLPDLVAAWAPDAECAGLVCGVLERAARLGHAGLADYATAEMTLRGQPAEAVRAWAHKADADLAAMAEAMVPDEDDVGAADVIDAEVVEGDSNVLVAEGSAAAGGDPDEMAGAPPDDQAARADDLDAQAGDKLSEAESLEHEDGERAAELVHEAERLHAEAVAIREGRQAEMDV